MKHGDEWCVLNYINVHRKGLEEPVTLENAKGMYIAGERRAMENAFGKELVTEIFGRPSYLEMAEIMLLEIEEGNISREQRWDNIINISYKISDACGKELDSNNPLWDKYAMLYSAIPIRIWQTTLQNPEELSAADVTKTEATLHVELLERMKTRITLTKENCDYLVAYCDYIFNLVHISLKKIFKEVKAEFMKP